MDARIVKTKSKLENALLCILERKLIENISVLELCNKADVNRSTFYVYYNSVEDLFDDMFSKILLDMKKDLQEKNIVSLEEWIKIYLKYAKENKIIFISIHNHSIDYHCIRQMTELITDYIDNKTAQAISENSLKYSYWYSGFFEFRGSYGYGCCTDTGTLCIESSFFCRK